MIAHLQGREAGARAVRVDGTPGRVDRAGMSAQRRVHPRPALCLSTDRSLAGSSVRPGHVGAKAGSRRDTGRPESLPDLRARDLPRARGRGHPPPPDLLPNEVLLRRLLSLDYVLEHTGLPWLPTEPEKVGAFETLGIERRILPSRLYRGAAGNTRRYFPVKLPVALEAERAVFVYVDPGHDTTTALRSWAVAHHGLWKALGERVPIRRGSSPSSGPGRKWTEPGTILENWTNTSTASGPSAGSGTRQCGPPRDRPNRAGHPQEG